jgi:polyhydroxybutyrate depolymerase
MQYRLIITILVAALCVSPVIAHAAATADSYGGRDMIVYVPAKLPPAGSRALVVVLHGGLGNAARIAGRSAEGGLNMDAAADLGGFVVAYLDGTPIARLLPGRLLGWNAGGGCCGLPARNGTDDVAYISSAVAALAARHGIDPARVYVIGHSNGAMMGQRMMCETTVFAAAVAISGPLNLDATRCPAARGRRILALHGARDENVPVAGGRGSKGLSGVSFRAEADAREVFRASGAAYTLQVVPGADHRLDNLDSAIRQTEHVTIADKAARFLGLAPSSQDTYP